MGRPYLQGDKKRANEARKTHGAGPGNPYRYRTHAFNLTAYESIEAALDMFQVYLNKPEEVMEVAAWSGFDVRTGMVLVHTMARAVARIYGLQLPTSRTDPSMYELDTPTTEQRVEARTLLDKLFDLNAMLLDIEERESYEGKKDSVPELERREHLAARVSALIPQVLDLG